MSNDDYKIGYKKPPKHTRFKKGQSGNPKGRLKRTDDKDFWGILEEVLKQGVSVRQGASTRVMQAREALIHALVGQGIKGNIQASKTLLQYMEKAQPIGHQIIAPVMIIKPPDGPAPPMPPIYGENQDEEND